MATLTVSTPARPRAVSWLRGWYDRAAAARAERAARSAVMRDLFHADPRDLRDLGISACDFDSIANGSFRR